MIERLARNWGWVVARGIIAILFGVLTLFNPGITLVTLVLLFGAYALLDGIALMVAAIAHRKGEPHWIALLAGGLLGVAAGVAAFALPAITATALVAVIGAWAVLLGIAELVAALRLRKVITGEWRFVVAGVLALGFGFLLILQPGAGALAMVLWIGAYAIVSGVLMLALGFRLRSWEHAHALAAPPA